MYAVTRTFAAPGARRRPPVNLTNLLLRALYGATGVAAALSLYTKLVVLIDDALPAAILTLIMVMFFLVMTARPERPR